MAENKKGGCLSLVVGGLVLCGIIGGCQNLFGVKDDSDYITSAHDYVESQLKSPSTASWCDNDEVTTNDAGDKIVMGCVDAENSFGATVRIMYNITEDKDTNVIDHLIMQK
jgi:hypothetical protein